MTRDVTCDEARDVTRDERRDGDALLFTQLGRLITSCRASMSGRHRRDIVGTADNFFHILFCIAFYCVSACSHLKVR